MSIFFIPALISLLLKAYILVINLTRDKISIVFLSLIVIFALHNGIELIGYILLFDNGNVSALFRPYYVITTYLVSYLLLHSLTVAGYENKAITTIVLIITTALSCLIIFSNSIIEGYTPIRYSVTAIEGKYYSVLSGFILFSLFLTTAVLLRGCKSTVTTTLQAKRCLYSLYALTPIILAFTAAFIFKIAGIELNASGTVPIATTIFLLVVLKTEGHHKLTDIRKFLPLSLEKQTSNNFMSILDHYINHKNEKDIFKTIQSDIEKEIISYSLKKCDYNVSKTTKMMGLKNRSTLYSMMNRLDIDIKNLKTINSSSQIKNEQ